jgi:diaminopimelate epimerase
MGIKFTKMQGCGNDFVVLDYSEYKNSGMEMPELAKKICDRHFGVGADGMIIPDLETQSADIGWFFYNSDGTTAQMCGNGMRCFAKYAYDNGFVENKSFTVKTLAGIIKPAIADNGNVRVNMSKPILESDKIPFIPVNPLNYKIAIKDKIFTGNAVSMGNPHFVIFVDGEENILELAKKYGVAIETAVEFPEKTNVEFIKINNPQNIELCVWERGCGITLACGTGACASVVVGILNGYLDNSVDVKLLGGRVNVEWEGSKSDSEHDVFLTGPAEYVYSGICNI